MHPSNELLYWIFSLNYLFMVPVLGHPKCVPSRCDATKYRMFYRLYRTCYSYRCGPLPHFTEYLVQKMSKCYINLSYFCFLCFRLYLKLHLLSYFQCALSFISRLIIIQKIDVDIKYLPL